MNFAALKNISIKAWVAIAAAIAVFSGVATIYSAFQAPSEPHNSDFFGRWNSDYSYPVTGGVFNFKGMTEYFHNGGYNVSGVITVAGAVNSKPYRFEYNVNGAGTWTADSSLLSFVLANMKSIPKSYSIDGTDIPTVLVAQMMGSAMPNLSDSYASNATGELKILSTDDNEMKLEGKDPTGKPFTINAHRQL